MRAAITMVLLVLAGCRQLLGLDDPRVIDGALAADAPRDAAADALPTRCPASYDIVVGASSYRFAPEATHVLWTDAAAACAQDLAPSQGPVYTHLAVFANDLERQILIQYRAPGTEYWIGLSDRVQLGVWSWVTDEHTVYPPSAGTPPWATGLPDGNMGASCVGLDPGPSDDGLLYNDFCATVTEPYICECDGYPDDPTRYSPPG